MTFRGRIQQQASSMEACLGSMLSFHVSFSFALNTHRAQNSSRTLRHGVKLLLSYRWSSFAKTTDTLCEWVSGQELRLTTNGKTKTDNFVALVVPGYPPILEPVRPLHYYHWTR